MSNKKTELSKFILTLLEEKKCFNVHKIMKRTFVISHAFRQHRSLKLCRGISLIYFTSVRKAITKIWFFTTKGRRHYCTSVQLFIFFNDLKGLILKIRKFLDTGLPTKDKTFETTTCMRCVSYRKNYENLAPPPD